MACFGFDGSCAVELISLLGQALGWLVLVLVPQAVQPLATSSNIDRAFAYEASESESAQV